MSATNPRRGSPPCPSSLDRWTLYHTAPTQLHYQIGSSALTFAGKQSALTYAEKARAHFRPFVLLPRAIEYLPCQSTAT
ncbi:hypothetical protein HBI56_056300 [Parastagonospora nodorum]|nr:hypothetical protein HBH53_149310 [Parastagonospora nodorum]KAH3967037.1 hypothetical protein HBH51_140710 [Parastagonospora nodorum]KAH4002855.1 hypothetical protein HBI10_069280 [Parastagonospora nodorum]KAH4026977.1 hypothetical protein HBI09_146530 [Parastagonospora nodorum]KAH4118392.1 hypothetical protein HBH47_141250 [Parastagonospora nodorum]